MKKIIVVLLALVLAAPFATTASAQSMTKTQKVINKQLQKALKKEYKEKMKQFKKEGWKLYGSTRSLEVALLSHYSKLEELGENGYEVMGEASKFKSMNVGKQMAVNNACNQYARQAGSHVKGRIVSDIAGNADDVSAEFDHFYSAYETLVEKEIKGEMQESFSVVKDFKDGTHAMQTYFIINEDAATKARIRAMENALKESQAAQKYAKKVSEFVQEGFEKEQDNSKKD
ncbi:MAG: hypothetical protein LKF06_05445 [Prevotella sp.]|jgi:hypothetical protein|nr:hypothetical protein [Prevotella sp.]MCH4017044.1 hypothetical protein [Prevotella sp.]MCH4100035.1 hypothetical protein [Prevotella sp.]